MAELMKSLAQNSEQLTWVVSDATQILVRREVGLKVRELTFRTQKELLNMIAVLVPTMPDADRRRLRELMANPGLLGGINPIHDLVKEVYGDFSFNRPMLPYGGMIGAASFYRAVEKKLVNESYLVKAIMFAIVAGAVEATHPGAISTYDLHGARTVGEALDLTHIDKVGGLLPTLHDLQIAYLRYQLERHTEEIASFKDDHTRTMARKESSYGTVADAAAASMNSGEPLSQRRIAAFSAHTVTDSIVRWMNGVARVLDETHDFFYHMEIVLCRIIQHWVGQTEQSERSNPAVVSRLMAMGQIYNLRHLAFLMYRKGKFRKEGSASEFKNSADILKAAWTASDSDLKLISRQEYLNYFSTRDFQNHEASGFSSTIINRAADVSTFSAVVERLETLDTETAALRNMPSYSEALRMFRGLCTQLQHEQVLNGVLLRADTGGSAGCHAMYTDLSLWEMEAACWLEAKEVRLEKLPEGEFQTVFTHTPRRDLPDWERRLAADYLSYGSMPGSTPSTLVSQQTNPLAVMMYSDQGRTGGGYPYTTHTLDKLADGNKWLHVTGLASRPVTKEVQLLFSVAHAHGGQITMRRTGFPLTRLLSVTYEPDGLYALENVVYTHFMNTRMAWLRQLAATSFISSEVVPALGEALALASRPLVLSSFIIDLAIMMLRMATSKPVRIRTTADRRAMLEVAVKVFSELAVAVGATSIEALSTLTDPALRLIDRLADDLALRPADAER